MLTALMCPSSSLLQHLKYHTQIHVRSRHGKNRGRKISGIAPLPGEEDKVSLLKLLAMIVFLSLSLL